VTGVEVVGWGLAEVRVRVPGADLDCPIAGEAIGRPAAAGRDELAGPGNLDQVIATLEIPEDPTAAGAADAR